jgi:hypothetical protein
MGAKPMEGKIGYLRVGGAEGTRAHRGPRGKAIATREEHKAVENKFDLRLSRP